MTSTFLLCGRHGTWWHWPSFCVASVALVALVALGWLWWRALVSLDAGEAEVLCLGGMAFGDIETAFVWQAWRLVRLTFLFCVAGVALVALGWLMLALVVRLGQHRHRWRRGALLGKRGTWWPFVWQAWHLVIVTVLMCCVVVCVCVCQTILPFSYCHFRMFFQVLRPQGVKYHIVTTLQSFFHAVCVCLFVWLFVCLAVCLFVCVRVCGEELCVKELSVTRWGGQEARRRRRWTDGSTQQKNKNTMMWGFKKGYIMITMQKPAILIKHTTHIHILIQQSQSRRNQKKVSSCYQ